MGAILQIFFDLSRPAADCLIKLFPTKNFLHLSSIQPHPKLPKIINIQSNTNPTLNPHSSLIISTYIFMLNGTINGTNLSLPLLFSKLSIGNHLTFPESYSKLQFSPTYLHNIHTTIIYQSNLILF